MILLPVACVLALSSCGVSSVQPDLPREVKMAVEDAGFAATLPESYKYYDTFELTKPNRSFGILSEAENNYLLCISHKGEFPEEALKAELSKWESALNASAGEMGEEAVQARKIKWSVLNYDLPANASKRARTSMLLAAFPSQQKGECIVVLGNAYEDTGNYDYQRSLTLIRQLSTH